jgi:site-specific DNA-methyltransferase (adenine-specific)
MEIKGYKDFYKQDKLSIYNMDNMELMKQIPDKYFDLAIVDPPYNISCGSSTKIKKKDLEWDSKLPTKEYFIELVRISKNQIIWGGNYMSLNIPFNSTHSIIWNKENGNSFASDCEIAFTSYKKNITKMFNLFWMGNMMKSYEKPLIHPTQKPISLYSWILEKYAKEGMKIFDSHLGSGSNAIASHYAKMEFIGCELDSDYYNDSVKRIRENTRQLSLLNLE